MDYILFGIQGSGKGTQGKILAKNHEYEYFEAGGELRKFVKETSELAKKVKEIMEQGKLVPVEVIMEIVENFASKIDVSKGIVFDGIPRNEKQRELFEALMQKLNRSPRGVLIEIPQEEAIRRITNRWMSKTTGKIYMSRELALQECPEEDIYQRADDNEESIKVRLAAYREETVPVINWYREQVRLIVVDGTPPVEEVCKLVEKAIQE